MSAEKEMDPRNYPHNVLPDEGGDDNDYMERARISCYLHEFGVSLRLVTCEKEDKPGCRDGWFRIVRKDDEPEAPDHAYLGHDDWLRLAEFFRRCAEECSVCHHAAARAKPPERTTHA